MAGTTIGTLHSGGITLGTSGSYISPLTITTSGAVVATGTTDAIFGSLSSLTLNNAGTVSAVSGSGVDLTLGGSVGNTGLITGSDGITISGAAGTVTNSGTITGTGASGAGIYLKLAGTVTNNAGLIQGYTGIDLHGFGTVTNLGSIDATNLYGIHLLAGGRVLNSGTITSPSNRYSVAFYELTGGGYLTNSLGGYIGPGGVGIKNDVGTVINAGTIKDTYLLAGYGAGVLIGNGGSVSNVASGLIQGTYYGVNITGNAGTVTNSGTILATAVGTIPGTAGIGVNLAAGGTVIDSGTISGIGGTAINFGVAGSNVLVLEHGYSLSGGVSSGVNVQGSSNTLELAGSVGAAVTVTLGTLGGVLPNFTDLLFAGSNDTLTVGGTTGTLGTIQGFGSVSDVIDLTGLTGGTIVGSGTLNGSHQLVVSNNITSVTLQFDASDSTNFVAGSDGGAGTDITPACYRRGTQILTQRGEVLVEDLRIGDQVITFSGAARPIKWIGRRGYDGRFVTGNRAVLPIRIEADALDDGVPVRDLFISPEHALYIDGELVPAGLLINGITIRQVESVERLEYFHIELDTHDAIFAEGAPAETYVDCDNRGMFQNAAEFTALFPDDSRPAWEFCAPRIEPGSARLNAIRVALLARAEALGRVTSDPDLHLIADGRIVQVESVANRVWRFALPAGTSALAIASRSAVPAATDASSADERALGVAVERIILSGAGLRVEIGHDCPALTAGFHEDEGSHRWTDGMARLPAELLRSLPSDIMVEVHLFEPSLRYRCEAPGTEAALSPLNPASAAPARPTPPPLAAHAAYREGGSWSKSISL